MSRTCRGLQRGVGWGLAVGLGLCTLLGLALPSPAAALSPPVDPVSTPPPDADHQDASGVGHTWPTLPSAAPGHLDEARLAQALSAWIRIDTQRPEGPESWALLGDEPEWVAFLTRTWAEPLGLEWEMLGGALVIRVPGEDAGPPVLWLSHADVVPVDPEDLDDWTWAPFEGVVADGLVYGRGALDNKAATVMQLEAVRALLESGERPSRGVVLAITPDEEVMGASAHELATTHLPALGSPDTVLDEGGFVLPDFYGDLVIAAVAVAEKTYLSLELRVRGQGGHSSMPRDGNPTQVLVEALARVTAWETEQESRPEMQEAFLRISAHEDFPTSVVLENPGFFESVLVGIVDDSAAGNAVTRNTVAVTILDAGVKDNVIPGEASATLNARLLPGVAVEDFMAELDGVIDDERVELHVLLEPVVGQPTPLGHPYFEVLEGVLSDQRPEAVVIPSLTPGTMDSRHFSAAGLACYRFIPVLADETLRASIHGNDERIPTSELLAGAEFYRALLTRQ